MPPAPLPTWPPLMICSVAARYCQLSPSALRLRHVITARGMRRTFQDLCRAAEIRDVVTRSVSGHATEAMQRRYSTVGAEEQRQGLAKVLSLMEIRRTG